MCSNLSGVYIYMFLLQILTSARTVHARTELLVSILREVIAVIVNLDFLETTVKQVWCKQVQILISSLRVLSKTVNKSKLKLLGW